MGLGWLGAPEHNRWLAAQTHALLRYARQARVDTGFGWIGDAGEVDETKPVELWITGRMTFAFSLGVLLGIPGCRRYADHGVECLTNYFYDQRYDGWYSAIKPQLDARGNAVPLAEHQRKECYQHAFVMLAAATASAAERPGAAELLREAMRVQETYWWDETHHLPIESYAYDFTDPENYRGINAAMHTVEAYLAAADVSGELRWLKRAVQIIDFAVNQQARAHNWRLPEHYDTDWNPRLDYNKDQVAHPFRPYGVTPGHGLEWARLTVQARAALLANGLPVGKWMLESAEELFERARVDGWRVDGNPGFVYTTDFDGKPVVHERMHWVLCEGVSAAAALRRALLDEGRAALEVAHYEHCYRSWIDYAEEYLIEAAGVWTHELDQHNRRSARTWQGHPDVYHALQMTLMPRLPVWPAMGAALAQDCLDEPL